MSAPTTSTLTRMEEIVGAAHVLADEQLPTGYEVDGLRPSAVVRPGLAEEIAQLVRLAAKEKLAVIPMGGRTKLGVGAPPHRYDLAIDLTRLDRVLSFDPGDLTLGVQAGIRFEQLNATVAAQRQFLPLAPPFADQATIGGILAANSSSPLRHTYGTARDFVLGMEFVTGEGAQVKSGGHVVKNVTGYDLHKLLIGALGTLAVITRVNFRTFPLPHAERTFVASFAGPKESLALCQAIAHSPLQPRLVEVLDPRAAQILDSRGRLPVGSWSVVTAAGGDERVVERHAADLARMAEAARATGFLSLTDEEKSLLQGRIREFPKHMMEFSPAATILRISVLPSHMPALIERASEVTQHNQVPSAMLVRASGLVYVALVPPGHDAAALAPLARTATALIQESSAAEIGGLPIIEFCPTKLKSQVNVWGPTRGDFVLMERLKRVFDPQGILSPGRFVGGI